MLLDQLPNGQRATIAAIDWTQMPEAEGRRLRALGIDAGGAVRIRYRGICFGRDPIAIEIGRMTIAIRRAHARAIRIEPIVPLAPALQPAE